MWRGTMKLAFQSTRPRGARRTASASPLRYRVSIHAPTGGATPIFRYSSCLNCCFNPRAHGGRDSTPSVTRYSLAMFQSTRPRGARRHTFIIPRYYVKFQSTRPRGARLRLGSLPDRALRVSIHAPTGGARLPTVVVLLLKTVFQSTRPRGARLPEPSRVCS